MGFFMEETILRRGRFKRLVQCFAHQKHGVYAVLGAIHFTLFLGLASFCLSVGMSTLERITTQASADLAVLSAAATYQYSILVDSMSKNDANLKAQNSAKKFFQQNDKSSTIDNDNITVVSDGHYEVRITEGSRVLFSSTEHTLNEDINLDIVSSGKVAPISGELLLSSQNLLNAAASGTLNAELNGIIMSVQHNFDNTITNAVFDESSYNDFSCREGTSIGYRIAENSRNERCKLWHTYNETLIIDLSGHSRSYETINLTLGDLHSSGPADRSIDEVDIKVYGAFNILIGEYTMNAHGNLRNVSPQLSPIVQVINDSGQPVPYNSEHEPGQGLGLITTSVTTNDGRAIKKLVISSDNSSVLFYELSDSYREARSVRLSK